jgi:hypothetical protein
MALYLSTGTTLYKTVVCVCVRARAHICFSVLYTAEKKVKPNMETFFIGCYSVMTYLLTYSLHGAGYYLKS